MRKTLLVGVGLGIAAVVVVVLNALLDLELDPLIVYGIALGAVVALVPDGSPSQRLAGFAAGVLVAWAGYLMRAARMPDSTSGHAVEVAVVVLACVAVAALSRGRLSVWSTLLGAAAMSGAYEYTYNAAPPEVVASSISTLTTLVLTMASGFVVGSLGAPGAPGARDEQSTTHRRMENAA